MASQQQFNQTPPNQFHVQQNPLTHLQQQATAGPQPQLQQQYQQPVTAVQSQPASSQPKELIQVLYFLRLVCDANLRVVLSIIRCLLYGP